MTKCALQLGRTTMLLQPPRLLAEQIRPWSCITPLGSGEPILLNLLELDSKHRTCGAPLSVQVAQSSGLIFILVQVPIPWTMGPPNPDDCLCLHHACRYGY